ncbi:MAG: hypothetical protein JWM19_3532 [Actinomycetia bacterium]|nr:hypothetical protein [Actinomycetes bacterium]
MSTPDSASPDRADRPPGEFSVFLSHSYQSSEVNLHFYRALSDVAPVTFRVDQGGTSTSVTRLERMVRDADAFIGIFPIPDDQPTTPNRTTKLYASRYFRLELDMAMRSRKPTAILHDRRYGSLFGNLESVTYHPYDAQDIGRTANSSARQRLQRAADGFFRILDARTKAAAMESGDHQSGLIGMLIPDAELGQSALTREVSDLLHQEGLEPRQLGWPARLDAAYISELRRCDWVIIDTSTPRADGLLAFLHGHSIPTLRVRQQSEDGPGESLHSMTEEGLYGAFEVGYRKDVIHWADAASLLDGLYGKIRAIQQEQRLIGDSRQATDYFTAAAKRRERVFLSYSSKDSAIAQQFVAELAKKFKEVFHYRSQSRDTALQIGKHWLPQLHEEISAATVGVVLVSPAYEESGYCKDEAERLYDAHIKGKLRLLPIRLDDARPLPLMAGIQQVRLAGSSPAKIVADFVDGLRADERAARG